MTKPDERRQLGLYFAMAQVGFEMVLPIVLGIFLDNWWGTGPWMVVVGAVVGLAGGLFHLVYLLNRLERKEPPDADS